MALIKCSGCGAEISPDAAACPKCGHPKAKQKANFWRPSGCAALVLGVVGVFFVVNLLTDIFGTRHPVPPPAAPTAIPTRGPTLTANQRAAETAKRVADEVATRKAFGPKLRQTFLDRKIDVKVKVEGASAERLVLSFALFDDVWVNDFKKGELCGEIRGLGFKSIDFTDGYNYAVRLPL